MTYVSGSHSFPRSEKTWSYFEYSSCVRLVELAKEYARPDLKGRQTFRLDDMLKVLRASRVNYVMGATNLQKLFEYGYEVKERRARSVGEGISRSWRKPVASLPAAERCS